MSRYTKEFIEQLQDEYDSGYTLRELIERHQTSFDSLQKYINTRTQKEALKITKKRNKLGGCCSKEYFGTKKHIESARRGGGFRKMQEGESASMLQMLREHGII